VDDDAVYMISCHADDEVGFGDVFTFDAATFVFREVKTTGSERFNCMIRGRTAPAECAGGMNTSVHAAKRKVMGK
jgi:hypothetical protein